MTHTTRPTLTYGRGIVVMATLVMPCSLLAMSWLIWLAEDDRVSLLQAIGNNGLPLYVFGLVPGIVLSALHTRILLNADDRAQRVSATRSAMLGLIFGVALGALSALILFATVHPGQWPLWLWGAVVGCAYGLLRWRLGPRPSKV